MIEIIIVIAFLIVGIIAFRSLKNDEKKRDKSFRNHLKKLESFEINLYDVKIDGFNWYETVPVDTDGEEVDPSSDFFYRTSMYDGFSNRYHKDKQVTKFSTKIIIPINYRGKKLNFHIKLPIEHTIIRMKFYIKKKAKIYIEDYDEKLSFIVDFEFLECEGFSFIKVQ